MMSVPEIPVVMLFTGPKIPVPIAKISVVLVLVSEPILIRKGFGGRCEIAFGRYYSRIEGAPGDRSVPVSKSGTGHKEDKENGRKGLSKCHGMLLFVLMFLHLGL